MEPIHLEVRGGSAGRGSEGKPTAGDAGPWDQGSRPAQLHAETTVSGRCPHSERARGPTHLRLPDTMTATRSHTASASAMEWVVSRAPLAVFLTEARISCLK